MIVGIIQARMGSTRLPGKINMPILGKPMLHWELERLKVAKRIDAWIVATTDLREDDSVAALASEAGFRAFRGSEKDVLDRYYQASREMQADVVVRVTGDCPLHDPAVIDLVIERYNKAGVDYTKTPENYPEGLDTEVFTFSALETSWKEARLPSEREHVTPYIRNHPERFKLDEKWSVGDFDHHEYHWSVDTEADFTFVEQVYAHLSREDANFTMNDILELITRHPELLEINKGGTGYEGLHESLREDVALRHDQGVWQ